MPAMYTLSQLAEAPAGRSVPAKSVPDLGRSRGRVKPEGSEAWSVDVLAYAAGVIDSDGSISIGLDRSAMRARRRGGGSIYRERVTLRQVDPQAVDLFHAVFGGSRFVYTPRRKRAHPLHSWQIGDRRASILLAALAPYLRLKRRQADLCVELRRLKDQRGIRRVGLEPGQAGDGPQHLAMGELRAEMLRLNRVDGRAARCASAAVKDVVLGAAEHPPGLLAYAAGVIDSDGSIGIIRKTYAMRILATTSQPTFSERVTVRQLESEAVDLLHRHFAGCRSVIVAKGKRWKRQPLQSLQLVDRNAAFLLAAVLPHLRIKSRQAELCLDMRRLKEESRRARFAYGRGHRGGGKRPAWITAAMEGVRAEILNHNRIEGRASRRTRLSRSGTTSASVSQERIDDRATKLVLGSEAG